MATPTVESAGNRIILQFESLDQAMGLLRPWHAEKLRAEAASTITRALEAVGLVVEVRVKGRAVAEVGLGGFHGSLLQLIGIVGEAKPAEAR